MSPSTARHRSDPDRELAVINSAADRPSAPDAARAGAPDSPHPDAARASALNDRGTRLAEQGRTEEGLAATREAVEAYRGLSATDPTLRPDLAGTLTNLAVHLYAAGRPDEARQAVAEAVETYRELAAGSPALLPALDRALVVLEVYAEPAEVDATRARILDDLDPVAGAVLQLLRSQHTEGGSADAATWLVDALRRLGENPALEARVRDDARRHHVADPTWDTAWERATGAPAPGWLTVDPTLLDAARGWISTQSYTDEHRWLADHPELLADDADAAVTEALLGVEAAEAERLTAVRGAAAEQGVDTVYRPTLLAVLAGAFARAEPAEQRMLVEQRRDELIEATELVVEWASGEGTTLEVVRAATLLQILGDRPPDDLLDALFAALAEPARFPELLTGVARGNAPGSALGNIASLAYAAADEPRGSAVAVVYAALALAEDEHTEQSHAMLDHALELAPEDRDEWVRMLLGLRTPRPVAAELADRLLNPES